MLEKLIGGGSDDSALTYSIPIWAGRRGGHAGRGWSALRLSRIPTIGSFGGRVVELQCLCTRAAAVIRVVLRTKSARCGVDPHCLSPVRG
jgi:hypothetical protein